MHFQLTLLFSTSTEAPMATNTQRLVRLPPCPFLGSGLFCSGDPFFPMSSRFFSCRNMVAAWAICGFWDWLMYLSPLAPRLPSWKNYITDYLRFKPFKIYPKLPTLSQVRHDAFWTSIGMVCATLLEAAYCWAAANHKIHVAASLAEAPFTHLVKQTGS